MPDSLHLALAHLLPTLTSPLLLPPPTLHALRQALTHILRTLYASTWQPTDPSCGSAFRSLIAYPGKLPRPLRQAALQVGVDLVQWELALREGLAGGSAEWQVWCDPGRVCVREGGWEWEDGVFYFGGWKDSIRTIWSSPLLATPASQAIPIRTPALSISSPPQSTLLELPCLPPFSDRPDSPSAESDISSSTFTSTSTLSEASSSHPAIYSSHHHHHPRPIERKLSDTESVGGLSVHLDRPRSASPSVHGKIAVTAYDGGKVGVLGGGVKLGGGGQSVKVHALQSAAGKRARSAARTQGHQYTQVHFNPTPTYNTNHTFAQSQHYQTPVYNPYNAYRG